jgi:hypothetical protein
MMGLTSRKTDGLLLTPPPPLLPTTMIPPPPLVLLVPGLGALFGPPPAEGELKPVRDEEKLARPLLFPAPVLFALLWTDD